MSQTNLAVKHRAIRGGFAKVCTQGGAFVLRTGSLMILGRLLTPADFGLVGMVTAITGFLSLFRDFGLSTATVQRPSITEDELSTLFWINLAMGAILAILCALLAPAVAAFYDEPRLFGITLAVSCSFFLNAAGVQHAAQLQRAMRFVETAVIELSALAVAVASSVAAALAGWGYWSLVVMTVMLPLASTVGYCSVFRWIPGQPVNRSDVRSMLAFGGTITLNGFVMYVAYNLEKALLGKVWGADALGVYGRAYQLVNIPVENLNTAIGGVTFSSLARLQGTPHLMREYFLKGYSLVLSLTLPISFACGLFAEDLIYVVLGPKWTEAAIIFRLLAPIILIFSLINPLVWLMFAAGLVKRSLHISFVLGPLVICGYALGLPYGPKGVAIGYSTVMILWLLPQIAWCIHGTGISLRDIASTVKAPLLSALVAVPAPLAFQIWTQESSPPLIRLTLAGFAYGLIYVATLLFAMGQKGFYLGLLRGLRAPEPAAEAAEVGSLPG